MISRRKMLVGIVILVMVIAGLLVWMKSKPSTASAPLMVGISPYQDLAMLVNYKNLDLEKKYGVHLELRTMAWEDILPAVGSGGNALDVGFGSLTEYLTKYDKLNRNSSDPIMFIYPLYVYKGGGFISFKSSVPPLSAETIKDRVALDQFLKAEFGAQKQSVYEMMLFSLARRVGMDHTKLKIRDIPLNDSLLAAQNGSIDVASAGLTQMTEARRQGGKVVLVMDDAGFADITGFICRESVLQSRGKDVEALVKIWFDCVNHVTSDLERNSSVSLEYLRKNSATRYTFEEYKTALDQEYLPRSVQEASKQLGSPSGRFPIQRIAGDVAEYLIAQKIVTSRPSVPVPINIP